MSLGRIHNISLKWKLLIPFLFLASIGAMALFLVSYRFQAQLTYLNEEKRLTDNYHYFLDIIDAKRRHALALATVIGKDPVIVEAFAARDRARLMELLGPTFQELNAFHEVEQLHFHVPPGISFLRVHQPDRYGDDLTSYRQTINVVMKTGEKAGGLEEGVFGLSMRCVVPVLLEGKQIGTVEVGSSFGKSFLESFSRNLDADVSIFVPGAMKGLDPVVFASTVAESRLSLELFDQVLREERAVFHREKSQGKSVAFIVGPVRNFSKKMIAAVVICVDRSRTLALVSEYRSTAIMIGLTGLVFSISFIWLISVVFTNRIATVVDAADQIASGHRDTRIQVKGADEIGVMADAINEMLAAMEESRKKIREYADNLELMVEQRTRALKESEESYRSLVENVPLVVYFVMSDGTAVFLNRYTEQIIGVPASLLTGHHEVWAEHIHSEDRDRVLAQFAACLREGIHFQSEYRMIHEQGHTVYVLDHAVPVLDNEKRVLRMDGIVLDVTARKELQEKIVQAEELETLSEVSARLAHEFRNPLTSIGGMTRRLAKSFDPDDDRKRKGELVVEEVGRLERILEMMTAYIEPKSIQLRSCELNPIVTRAVEIATAECDGEAFSVSSHLAPDVGVLQLDSDLFEKILVTLLKNACFRMNRKGRVQVTTIRDGSNVNLTLAYELPFIADDDIDHFFYPFVVDYPFRKGYQERDIMDVPICRVLIHKHGGIINVNKEKDKVVKITIVLPQS